MEKAVNANADDIDDLIEQTEINESDCKKATLKVEKRADFSTTTIRELYRSTGGLCSCPTCQRPTMAKNPNTQAYINIGEAAHIFGAKRTEKSPRSSKENSNDFLKGFENGIWLCKTCHKIIDDDEYDYPSEKLIEWKQSAEKYALDCLIKGKRFSVVPDYSKLNIEIMTVFQRLVVCYTYINDGFYAYFSGSDGTIKFRNFLESGKIDTSKLNITNLNDCLTPNYLEKELEIFIRVFSKHGFSVCTTYDDDISYDIDFLNLFKVITGKDANKIPNKEFEELCNNIFEPLAAQFVTKK